MNADNLNIEARERNIETLKLVIAQNDLALTISRQTLDRMVDKQINRRAELRCQMLMLQRAERLAARAEVASS